MEQKFSFLIKEFYFYITENLPRDDVYGNFLGDWKIVKQKLNDGDLQIVIYRKNTEINFLFSEQSRNQIELFTRIHTENEKELVDSLVSYFNYHPESKKINHTFKFRLVNDFEKYIYQFLLK